MEKETISLSQALEIFNRRNQNGELLPFDISFLTFSKTKRQGGTLKVYEGVRYLPPANPDDDKPDSVYRIFGADKVKRDPNLYEHRQRNIEMADGSIRKVNIDFIILVNDCKVIY